MDILCVFLLRYRDSGDKQSCKSGNGGDFHRIFNTKKNVDISKNILDFFLPLVLVRTIHNICLKQKMRSESQCSEQGALANDAHDAMLTFFTGRDKNARLSKERSIKFPLKVSFNKSFSRTTRSSPKYKAFFFSLFYSSCNLVVSFQLKPVPRCESISSAHVCLGMW